MLQTFWIILTWCAVLSRCRVLNDVPPPLITSAPSFDAQRLARSAAASAPLDPLSLAEVLLTAIPSSLRQIAATNLPEVSAILWSEFLDGKKPSWFTSLPSDVQEYLTSKLGPTTSAATTTAASGSTLVPASASASSVPTSASAPSAVPTSATVTSLVTITASSQSTPASLVTTETNDSGSGLSSSGKLAIGLGIPLAVAVLVALVLAICLIRQRRASKRRLGSVESRPPTPAFIGSTMAPTVTTTIRGGASSDPLARDVDARRSDPFADPPDTTAVAGVRQKRGSRSSFGTLTPVSEEVRDDDIHRHISPVPVPERSPRRSRDYFSPHPKDQQQPMVTTTPLSPVRHNGQQQHDWQSQHPALRTRDSMSFSTPYGPYGRSTDPYAMNGPNSASTSLPRRKPVPQRTHEPLLGGSTNRDNPPNGHVWPWSGDYWKAPKRSYDRYENVTMHEDT